MTALEFIRAGVVFERDAHASIVALDGPDALVGDAEAEVIRRADAMRDPPRLPVAAGRCEELIRKADVREAYLGTTAQTVGAVA